jgi:FimV-like protein
VFWANPGDALAQASSAAASAATGQTYAVKPGQSLNDIAGELTGSKDRDVRARAARALFDANPNAFGGHDINKLKLGAVLNVPADLSGAAAPAGQENAPAEASGSATAAPASESAAAASSAETSASAVAPEASAPAGVASAPEAAPESASAPAMATASAPASTAPTTALAKGGGMSPAIIGIVIAVIAVLLLLMRRGKRRQAKAPDDRAPRAYSSLEEAQADADARNASLAKTRAASAGGAVAAAAAADLEGKAVERGQSELDAVASSLERADTAQPPTTPSDDELPPTTEARGVEPTSPAPQPEPFVPVPPAAHHPDFVPPLPTAPAKALEEPKIDRTTEHEAERWEAEEREAAARRAAAREAEERENRAREAAAQEALAREQAAREAESREAELREVTEREEQAREAAAREITARDAELRELQARAAEEQAAERRDIQAHAEAEPDEEPALKHSFPMPKFPQEAISALDSLEMGLPPRLELKLNPPGAAASASPVAASATPQTLETPPGVESAAAQSTQPLEQAPFVPQPVARMSPAQQAGAVTKPPQSVASQIEAGTAGPASVAGLGATKYGPLSLDFDLGPASSATEPLPALTPAQLATIARNKLELASEYIELGDLQGARTLLQEVIESNDSATRQQAATLLSTLAPHS